MSEMVERVARALLESPGVHGRTNKMRADGLIYEIGYLPEGGQEFIVLRAMSTIDGYGEAVNEEQSRINASIAIAAMREPTEAMLSAAWSADVDWRDVTLDDVAQTFKTMIDEALK